MKKAQHTPGPWHVEPCQADHGRSIVVSARGVGIICLIEPDDCNTFDKLTDEANARLIAAAPTMFETLDAASFIEQVADLIDAGKSLLDIKGMLYRVSQDMRRARYLAINGEE